jgi:sigma-B regulation protein RsbU (phosphoserine phosphatase)
VAGGHGADRHRELYDRAACGLLVLARDGTILESNRTFSDWLGYAPEELIDKRRFSSLLTIGGRIFQQTHLMPLLHMQGSVGEVQLELVHRDGRQLPVLINALVHEVDGVPRYELAVFTATDRRQYERELLAARKRAEELLARERDAQEALQRVQSSLQATLEQRALLAEQLVGIVSHDLRTPIAAILLGASQLGIGSLDPLQTRLLARMTSAAERANRLVSELLDFTQSRIGGGLRVQPRAIDLHAVVRDCVEELRLASDGCHLEHVASGSASACADPDRIAQVVTNLLCNARAYGAKDRLITVTSEIDETRGSVTVHNFGPPIPPALIPHLFEPMRRGDQQVEQGSRSVGLGLYIVHQIAVAHGGDVEVTSDEQHGTRFRVRWPVQPAARDASKADG